MAAVACASVVVALADDVAPARATPVLTTPSVTPATLKKLTNFNNTVFVALYVPTLPRWPNFSRVLEDVHLHFQASPQRNVHVVRADCAAHVVRCSAGVGPC